MSIADFDADLAAERRGRHPHVGLTRLIHEEGITSEQIQPHFEREYDLTLSFAHLYAITLESGPGDENEPDELWEKVMRAAGITR